VDASGGFTSVESVLGATEIGTAVRVDGIDLTWQEPERFLSVRFAGAYVGERGLVLRVDGRT